MRMAARRIDGAADARAAHPPREGDIEHLHGAGAAREYGGDVRRVSRARRTPAIAGASTVWTRALERLGTWATQTERTILRHAIASADPKVRGASSRARAAEAGSTSLHRRSCDRHLARRNDTCRGPRDIIDVFRNAPGEHGLFHSLDEPAAVRSNPDRAAPMRRTSPFLTHPVFNIAPLRNADDAATSAASSARTSASTRR